MSKAVSKKKTVDEIVEEINQLDIGEIQLDPKNLKFLTKVGAYRNCFDKLQALYEEVDPSHKLANHDMLDIKQAAQQLPKRGQPVKSLAELYVAAETMFPVFASKIEGLVEGVTSDSPEASGVKFFKLPPRENKLKGKQRTSKTTQGIYNIVRGSVSFETAEQLYQFFELLGADESIAIVNFKNRFRNPTLSGYRDFHLEIQITNDEDSSMKHICKLQLHINAITEAAIELKSHAQDAFFRIYFAGTKGCLKERMDDLRVICTGGSLDMAFLANAIRNPLESEKMARLATLFADNMGEYQLAIMFINAIRGRVEARSWYRKMGHLLENLGKLEEAMEVYHKALDIDLKTLELPYDLDTADSYNNMATVLVDQGKLEEAIELFKKALGIRLKVLGPFHADVAYCYNNMAVVLKRLDKLAEAMELHQKALEIRLKVLGPDHRDVADSYSNMAIIVHSQGKLEEATELYQKALENRLKTLGPNHIRVAATCNGIGYALFQQNRLEEALEVYQKALDIHVKAFGENHPSTACTRHSIGEILFEQGKLEEAKQFCENAFYVFLRIHGPGHRLTTEGRKLIHMIRVEQRLASEKKNLMHDMVHGKPSEQGVAGSSRRTPRVPAVTRRAAY